MKRTLLLTAVMVAATMWVLPTGPMAQSEEGSGQGAQGGQCYFQASENVYLQIYYIGSEGVERQIIWSGYLSAGDTKAYNSPDGRVGYATTDDPQNPWDEDEQDCIDGEAIDIP